MARLAGTTGKTSKPAKPRASSWRREDADGRRVRAALARIGRQVRSYRKELELTQRALAESAGLDEKHIQDIEHGRSNVTVGSLVMIARALKIELQTLVSNEPPR